jgi:hypothetical protein
MNKRTADKINKRAVEKTITGEPKSQMETIVFNKYMEKWLGPDIVHKIKHLGKKEFYK